MNPPTPKRPGLIQLEVYKANQGYQGITTYYFLAKDPKELSFEEGDIILVQQKGPSSTIANGYWKCKSNGKEGLIPVSVVEEFSQIELPMHEAAKRGNVLFLKELMQTGLSVNTLDAAGNCPLYWAARFGHLNCVKIILAAHPVLDQQNKLGDTVLHGAAWGGHADIIKLLLELQEISELKSVKNKEGLRAFDLAKNSECAALLDVVPISPNRPADFVQDDDSDDES